MRGYTTCLIALLMIALAAISLPVKALNYAEHTPGHQHKIEGLRSYNAGQYYSAKSKFTAAAHWADKLAQYNIGVMNYHGQGVPRDLARAWAWFSLAAERGYPDMIDMAERVYGELDDDQKTRGREILEELKPRFGDAVAIERTARYMDRERRRATGSRLGSIGTLVIVDRPGQSRRGEEFYRAEAWDFRQIVELESRIYDAIGSGRVTLRDLEVVHGEDEVQDD